MPTRKSSIWIALLAAISLSACGGDSNEPSEGTATDSGTTTLDTPTPASKARAAIEAMFAVVKSKDRAALAPLLVYRLRDKERKWKAPFNYENKDEQRSVDGVFSRIESLLLGGTPEFTKFESETKSEGTWLIWFVTLGDKKVAFACLEIDGTVMLGDMDNVK